MLRFLRPASLIPSLFALSIGLAGCGKRATASDCKSACEHTARFAVAEPRKQLTMKLHELDEAVESAEDSQKQNAERVQREAAQPDPRWPQGIEAGLAATRLAPAARKALLERHQWEQSQLTAQRATLLQHDVDFLAERRRTFDEAKQKGEAAIATATSDAVRTCVDTCVAQRRTVEFTACLLRTQAIEDVEICSAR